MKILQLNPAFYPAFAYGGTVNVSYNLAKALAKRGHDVTVFTSDTIDKHTRQNDLYVEHEGMKIFYFRNVSNLLAWHRFLLYPGLIRALKKNIQDFDIVHLHGTRNFQNIIAAHYAKKYGIPYVIQPHGSLPLQFGKQNLKKIFDMAWGNKILQNASKCIALTKTESDQYIKMGVPEEKIVIIPNGLDLSQFSNLPERGTFRKKYGISDNKQIILFLGRIHKIKGIDLLIDAYSLVLKDLPHARLVIAGPDDGYLLTIQEQIQRLNLKMAPLITGPLYDRDKLEAYVDADVYVLPSRYEIFGNTILEAWACGTPVIVTDSCAISSVAQHGGFVVKRDPIELATAIKRLLIKESLWEVYSNNGKILVNKEFNLESVVAKIEACYRQVIQMSMVD